MLIETQKSLAPFTTIGIGGPARWYISCRSIDDIVEGLKWARSKAQPVHILGGGSNSLIADAGFAGVVLHIQLLGSEWHDDGTVEVKAGEQWDDFVAASVCRGLSGVECLSGIPGMVGSTPIQNVGAYGQEVKEVIIQVNAIDRNNYTNVSFTADECEFAYRMSRFKGRDRNRFIITSVVFKLSSTGLSPVKYPELQTALEAHPRWQQTTMKTESLQIVRDVVIAVRARKGMVVDREDPDSRSLGSFFMNPIVTTSQKDHVLEIVEQKGFAKQPGVFAAGADRWKLSAAWLIEHSGTLKNESLLGAAVSSKHTLALVNRDQATRADILALAEIIRRRVHDVFGITLEQEPELVG